MARQGHRERAPVVWRPDATVFIAAARLGLRPEVVRCLFAEDGGDGQAHFPRGGATQPSQAVRIGGMYG